MSETWPTWMIRAQDVGLIGPASLRFHHDHALGFAQDDAVAELLEQQVDDDAAADLGGAIDLGSGGGLPGLVLATAFPSSTWTLLDARLRSREHLDQAIDELEVEGRVSMALGRAEEYGRKPESRETFKLATARGFAKPAITAEITTSVLAVGGLLVVSEPPEDVDRWPAAQLEELGLEPANTWETKVGHYRSLVKVAPTPERYPRRVGIPEKRPLF